jgi:7-carboxy-7-deazaguanine synthase
MGHSAPLANDDVQASRQPSAPGASLPVVETFHSLQGEGLHAGRSAFFIRLAGCRVGCSWCDTKHSWPEASHPRRRLADLAAEARAAAAAGAGFVVITGGEPLHHPLDALCEQLRAATAGPDQPAGLPLHLETSGVDPLSGRFDWITLSPKPHRPPKPELLDACDELKVVVAAAADLRFAEAMARQACQGGSRGAGGDGSRQAPALLLQPVWANAEASELTIDFVRRHPAWRLSLQSHKWLGLR